MAYLNLYETIAASLMLSRLANAAPEKDKVKSLPLWYCVAKIHVDLHMRLISSSFIPDSTLLAHFDTRHGGALPTEMYSGFLEVSETKRHHYVLTL